MFKGKNLLKAIEKTNLIGKSVLSMDVFSTQEELLGLFEVAEYLEPFVRTGGLNLLPGKVMASLAFEASTRTMIGFETSMQLLGGSVTAQRNPMATTRMQGGESLKDTLKILARYVHVIAMRHIDYEIAAKAVVDAEVPILTGGFGGYEHPFQACGDLYAIWRTIGKVDNLTIFFPAPEINSSRVAHSVAYGFAKFGGKIIFATDMDGKAEKETVDRIKELGGVYEEITNPTRKEIQDLSMSSDIVYLPCWIRALPDEKWPDTEDGKRKLLEKWGHYYIPLDYFEKAKAKGKMVYLMHPGTKTELEADPKIDETEHSLYWEQVEFSLPARMAVILSVLYGT